MRRPTYASIAFATHVGLLQRQVLQQQVVRLSVRTCLFVKFMHRSLDGLRFSYLFHLFFIYLFPRKQRQQYM